MALLNVNAIDGAKKFNWDDIEVGNSNLDHSQNFFAQKHIKHERLPEDDELDIINEMVANSSLVDNKQDAFAEENKENVMSAVKAEVPVIKVELASPRANKVIEKVESEICEVPVKEEEPHTLDVTAKVPVKPNLACQWSTQKPIVTRSQLAACNKGTFAKPAIPAPPAAYKYNQLYQKKKEEALKKRLEEERKLRQFHCRPVPNFHAHHEQLEKRKVPHAATVPVTPKVLKKSREAEEKRKKRLEEYNRQHAKPPKFEARSTKVLEEEPFKPKKVPTHLEQRPFNLHTDKRVHERRHFDEAVQRALEEKQKQEEEERKKREEEYRKEIRKLATFKARPNPFK